MTEQLTAREKFVEEVRAAITEWLARPERSIHPDDVETLECIADALTAYDAAVEADDTGLA